MKMKRVIAFSLALIFALSLITLGSYDVADAQSVTVYVTETGEKYHRDGCQYLRRSKIPIALEDARLSYDPCSRCNPPQ